jgi:mRNA deadenylase 3'-5' endonuclease subunit Ccr4
MDSNNIEKEIDKIKSCENNLEKLKLTAEQTKAFPFTVLKNNTLSPTNIVVK